MLSSGDLIAEVFQLKDELEGIQVSHLSLQLFLVPFCYLFICFLKSCFIFFIEWITNVVRALSMQ